MSEAALPGGFARLLSDDWLAQRAVGGDRRAFAAIFRRYHQSLYRYCLAIVGNPDDAQDALQNTMIKVLGALPGEERKINLKPWLYRIAHNESIDLLRRRRETRQLDVEQAAPGGGPAEDAVTRERLRGLIADLGELPERQRGVLVMRELGGLEFDEIGSALGTSGAVARQTLYEARQSLRQMEGGREMSCDAVTLALSDGDGRVTRRRDVRAHLRSCPECRRFRGEIESRQRDLAALAPLPAVAAAGMLHGLAGSHAAGGGGLASLLGGGAAKSLGASAAVKGVATVAVVAAIGVTAADRSGVIHLGLPGERGAGSADQASPRGGSGGSAATNGGGGSIDNGGGEAGAAQRSAKAGGDGSQRAAGTAAQHRPELRSGDAASTRQVPAGEGAGGRGKEKPHPSAPTKGKETAAAHQAKPDHAGEHGASGPVAEPVKPDKPTHTAPAPQEAAAPPEGAPVPTHPEPTPQAEVTTPGQLPSTGSGVIGEANPGGGQD